jgi:hypothetical protein
VRPEGTPGGGTLPGSGALRVLEDSPGPVWTTVDGSKLPHSVCRDDGQVPTEQVSEVPTQVAVCENDQPDGSRGVRSRKPDCNAESNTRSITCMTHSGRATQPAGIHDG